MAAIEGGWWSRAWGAVALLAFAVHLGAAVYEAAIIAPLWSLTPPQSVVAWVAVKLRPDSSVLFQPLLAVIFVATTMSWLSGVTQRGWRRWWLTLSLVCAGALTFVVVVLLTPCERSLLHAAALGDGDPAAVVALTGDWIRAASFRLAALLVGAWSMYRAQLAGAAVFLPAGLLRGARSGSPVGPSSGRRGREFAFGDEPEAELSLGDETANPRERWMATLPRRRRTAKK